MAVRQFELFSQDTGGKVAPFTRGLLKWVGSKQKMAHTIIEHFPTDFQTYFEPFIGSGAVLGTLAPVKGVGSDVFAPLMEIWSQLSGDPEGLKEWYRLRWEAMSSGDKKAVYAEILASYNSNPNGADFVFLTRSCYGGVVRFRKADGFMSTPCGTHTPISPDSFNRRVDDWARRTAGTEFVLADYREVMATAKAGDLVYCDPPYSDSQSILYGAQDFSLTELIAEIERSKSRGVRVALSIDGHKKSGSKVVPIAIPEGLFESEVMISLGRSMLRRFQMAGQTLESEEVSDRLLLTYRL